MVRITRPISIRNLWAAKLLRLRYQDRAALYSAAAIGWKWTTAFGMIPYSSFSNSAQGMAADGSFSNSASRRSNSA
jgi:hypothetical protein